MISVLHPGFNFQMTIVFMQNESKNILLVPEHLLLINVLYLRQEENTRK